MPLYTRTVSQQDLDNRQPLDGDLTSLAALNTTGIVERAGANSFVARSLVSGDIPDLSINKLTSGILPIVRGGTGSTTQNFVDLTNNQTIAGNKTFSSTLTLNNGLQSGGEIRSNGITLLGGNGINDLLVAPFAFTAGNISGGNLGVGLPNNRLLGATTGRYTVTTTNISNIQNAFDGYYDSSAVQVNAAQPAVVEIDFAPEVDTASISSGYTFSTGLTAFHFLVGAVPTNVRIEHFRRTGAGTSSEWFTIFDSTTNTANPVIVSATQQNFLRRVRFTFSHSNGTTATRILQIEQYGVRHSPTASEFPVLVKYSQQAQDITSPAINFRDASWNTRASITREGQITATSLSTAQRTVTSSTTLTATDHTIFANSSSTAITLTLPAANTATGRMYRIIQTGTNNVTIAVPSGGVINGVTNGTVVMNAQYSGRRLYSDGLAWFAVG